MANVCNEPSADIIGKWVDDGKGNYKGECVSLVKLQCAALAGKQTKTWKPETPVKGANIPRGTAIATFKNGHYLHAAIYISQDAKGVWVWDQYNDNPKNGKPGIPVGKHYIQFKKPDDPHPDYNATLLSTIK